MKKTVLAVCIAMVFTPGTTFAETASENEKSNNQTCEALHQSDNPDERLQACDEGSMLDENMLPMAAGAGLIAVGGAVLIAGGSSSGGGNGGDNGGDNGGGNGSGEREDITIDNDTSVAGEGNTGQVITGGDKDITINGDISSVDGGNGLVFNGDNNTINSEGNIDVSGDNSVGLEINGDNTATVLNGNVTVRDGGLGVNVQGDDTTMTNNGNIDVADKNSVGIKISGDRATFTNTGDIYVTDNGVGAMISGDGAKVIIDGSLKVDAGLTRNPATGVSITSDNAVLEIKGDVRVTDINDNLGGTNPTLTGISVTGNNTVVNIDGKLGVDYYGSLDNLPNNFSATFLWGLKLAGDKNSVLIKDGLDFNYYSPPGSSEPKTRHHNNFGLVKVSGDNNIVQIGGVSDINVSAGMIKGGLVSLDGSNNTLWFDDTSKLTLDFKENLKNNSVSMAGIINMSGQNSLFINDGYMTSTENTRLLSILPGTAVNNGLIEVTASPQAPTANSYFYFVFGDTGGGKAEMINSTKGVINISSAKTADSKTTQYGTSLVAGNYKNTQYGLYAQKGVAQNDGEMNLAGTAIFGLASGYGTAINTGTITTDAMQLEADEEGNLTGNKILWSDKTNTLRGGAVYVGLNLNSGGTGLGLNTGTINVNNAGFGMVAYRGGTVINDGVINLTADHELADGMYALAAVGSNALAINGKDGVININTDLGSAFYTASGGMVANNGTVNLNGSSLGEGEAGWGENINYWAGIADSVLSSAGENISFAGTAGDGYLLYAPDVSSAGHVSFDKDVLVGGALNNSGTLMVQGAITGNKNNAIVNAGTVIATQDGQAGFSKTFTLYNQEGGLITNTASAAGSGSYLIDYTGSNRSGFLVNRGDIEAKNGYGAITMTNASNTTSALTWLYNTDTGRITGENLFSGGALIKLGNGYSFHNAGEISFTGSGSSGIIMNTSSYTSYVVNDGVINVGTEEGKASGTNGNKLAGIRTSALTNVVYNNADGVINVWADDSYAFVATTDASKTKVVNNGTVNLFCDSNCGISGSGNLVIGSGDDYTSTGTPGTAPSAVDNTLSNYTIGTNADGSAGKLAAQQIAIGSNVFVDTGFAAGVSDRQVTFENVLSATGDITGEGNIASSSVVWHAQASKNTAGNIDVTMTKNDYINVATDKSTGSIASALDNAYTSNSLYNSLNVSSVSALNKALKQVSGAQASGLNREARVLGQRFNMLSDTAPVTTENGLSMNLVAKGDKRAEMDNKVTYDMMALRQAFGTDFGNLSASYGMARLSGKGGNDGTRAGDNGLTGGYSQFFGLGHSLALNETTSWDNSLRYDLHNLSSSRNLSFEGTSRVARSDGRQQHLEFRSEGTKRMEVADGLTVAPFAGAKMRHHITEGYQERGAGDFNLKTSNYNETAVDAVAGLRLNYAGKDGWGAQASLEAGPNLGFSQSVRKASLQGAQGQQFAIEDGNRGGAVNSQAMVSANYSAGNNGLAVNAYQWKEDGASDKGLSLNFIRGF